MSMRVHDERSATAATDRSGRGGRAGRGVATRAAALARRGRLGAAAGTDMLALQRAAGNAAVVASRSAVGGPTASAESPREVLARGTSGGGAPLAAPLRAEMQARLGADFSDVRVHTDAGADGAARSMGAAAYTVGSDVVFARGQYDPASRTGKTLLAHELTHVVQQRTGPVAATSVGDGVAVSDPGDVDERAAATTAARVMAAPVPAGDGAA